MLKFNTKVVKPGVKPCDWADYVFENNNREYNQELGACDL